MPSRLTSFLSVLMPSPVFTAALRKPVKRHLGTVELSALPDPDAWRFPNLIVAESLGDGTHVQVRCRRPRELPSPWRESIAAIFLEDTGGPAETHARPAFHQARAILHEGALSLGGVPVVELMLCDNGDALERHYVLAHSYLRARACLRTLIESRAGYGARMDADPSGHGGLYLEADDGGCWLHADAEDSRRTRFIHVQLD